MKKRLRFFFIMFSTSATTHHSNTSVHFRSESDLGNIYINTQYCHNHLPFPSLYLILAYRLPFPNKEVVQRMLQSARIMLPNLPRGQGYRAQSRNCRHDVGVDAGCREMNLIPTQINQHQVCTCHWISSFFGQQSLACDAVTKLRNCSKSFLDEQQEYITRLPIPKLL